MRAGLPLFCLHSRTSDCPPGEYGVTSRTPSLTVSGHSQDFGSGEILLNFGGGFTQPINGAPQNPDAPFRYVKWRHLFPLRYYLNDFELAVQFDADSDPSTRTRLVQGLPTAAWGHTSQDYLKELAPESLKEEPYCPFKADVYQVAFCSAEVFCASPLHLTVCSPR